MSFPKLSRLSFKLPAMVAGAIITVAVGLGTINYLSARSATLVDAHARLEQISHSRLQSLQVWFERLEITMKTAAANPLTVSATETFLLNYGRLDDAARNDIRLAYTDLNPFPAGERQNLDAAEGFSFYHVAHEGTHPAFREFNEVNHLYDTFIVSMEGDIIYSVFKENDFGQNILTGELSSSGIGEAFSLSLQAAPGDVAFSHFAPYAPSAGQMAGFASSPVFDADGAQIGVLIVQMNTIALTEVINDPVGLEETGKVFLINNEGQVITDSRFEDGPAAMETVPFTDHIVASLRGENARVHNAQGLFFPSVSAVAQWIELGGLQYSIIVEKSMDEILEPVVRQRNMAAIVTVIGASIMSLIAWLFIRSVTGSIERIQSEMMAISDGNYATEVTSVRRADEIGDIGRSLVDFKTKLEMAQAQTVEREREQEDQNDVLTALRKGLIELAEGDLTHPIEQEFTPQYESLRADFNETLRTLSDAISNVIRVTGSITHGAGEISQASDDLSNRTENQAATLEQTAAALDELTASVKSAADGAKSVEVIVVEAQSEAEESGVIVGNAIAAMTEIEKSSEHINQIIGVIDDIAFQTNLLALNAGVEAARAGDAGKGFAVVASEVRALAQRSSDAAKEIKALISDSSKQVERGVDLVGGAGKALDSIVQRVTHISELIRNIANGSSEQAIGLGEINIGVNQLDQVTQQNAAMVEEATAASHVLKGDASQLQDLVTRFKTLEAKGHDTQFVHSNAASDAPSFQNDYATDADDDVIEVEFTRTRDTQENPDPVPIAVGDVPASSNKGPQADEWQEF